QQAAAAAPFDAMHIWLPEFVQRFAVSLPPNTVACVLRLVDKAAAARFRLSQPVRAAPRVCLALGTPGAMRCLVHRQREVLPRLTAGSGTRVYLEDALSPLTSGAFGAAAAVGQLAVCVRLRERGCCPWTGQVLAAAVGDGHRAVYEWLLAMPANGCPNGDEVQAAVAATLEGHVGLMEWLLGAGLPTGAHARGGLMQTVLAGCNLAATVLAQGMELDAATAIVYADAKGCH
ncbi:hypothetical protein TSOC_011146, partial [Tetrabaena socialis]